MKNYFALLLTLLIFCSASESYCSTPDSKGDSILRQLKSKYLWISEAAELELSSTGYWNSQGVHEMLFDGTSYLNQDHDYAFHTRFSTFEPEPDSTPFVIIDLLKVASVDAMLLKNRTKNDKIKKRADGLTVWFSEDKENWQKIEKIESLGEEWHFECAAKGRYIKLGFEEKRNGPLHLRAIWVFVTFDSEEFEGKWVTTDRRKIGTTKITPDRIGKSTYSQIGRSGSDYQFLDHNGNLLAKARAVSDDYLILEQGDRQGLLKRNNNLPDIIRWNTPPKILLGNWLNTSDGAYWQLGLMPEVAIYDNQIWQYDKVEFDGVNYRLVVSQNGNSKTMTITLKEAKLLKLQVDGKTTMLTSDTKRAKHVPQPATEKNTSATQVVVQGYIEGVTYDEKYNRPDANIEFLVKSILFGKQLTFTPKYKRNGSFVVTFDLPNAQSIYYRNGRGLSSMFVAPGDTITMFLKKDSNTEVLYMGNYAHASRDLHFQSRSLHNALPDWQERKDSIIALGPEAYKRYRMRLRDQQQRFVDEEVLNDSTLSQTYKVWANYYVEYEYFNDLLRYRWMRSMYTKDRKKRDMPPAYYDFVSQINFENKGARMVRAYGDIVHELAMVFSSGKYPDVNMVDVIMEIATEKEVTLSEKELQVMEQMRKTIDNQEQDSVVFKNFKAIYDRFDNEIQTEMNARMRALRVELQIGAADSLESNTLKELFISRAIYKAIASKDLHLAQHFFDSYNSQIKSDIYRELLEKELTQLKDLIASQLPDYVRINETPESKGEELLKSIIAQHKGKVLYLDFWATWCGPCIRSFEFAKKLKEHFEGKDVVFVYLCGSNSNPDAYKNILKAHDVKGEHYYLEGAQWQTLWEKFKVTGIPHYALINKEGQVQDSGAPDPHTSEIIEAIEKLL